MTDFLKYALPDQVWALDHHLETAGGLPVYTVLGIGEYWDIKNKQGWPWDRFVFDDHYIYQSITENDLVPAATAYKIFTANVGKGIIWGPRQYVPGESRPMYSDSSYRRYATCGQFQKQDLGAPSCNWVEGPYDRNFGGDLGTLSALKAVYLWGAGLVNMEINWYAPLHGRVSWELWQNGTQKQIETYNLIKPGGVPPLVFPCGPVKL